MSGDWRRLHRVRGVSGGSLENHWGSLVDPPSQDGRSKTEVQQHRTGLTDGSDRWVSV
jgi:hypothetical protein